ncbi:hypothetical protein [Planobispora longispora]|uniref:LysM domain-containing protein n=1 Tax=Planobispora longispora TaxID=28887 RepID=A0A8J3W5C5_9ACTN|nr:hypothetical protein [Planobispora longispora]BFE81937.1 hypothetical protein GCM10020093_045380 [Planobispora longispora]GIH76338.1 hypothetical protein Plo01_27670 [Planobispora longispora]
MVALLVLGALGMLWLGTRIAPASAADRAGRAGLPWVEARHGDALWEVAEAVTPEGDPAGTVRRITDLNGLSVSMIRPGGRLYLPEGLAG